MAGHEAAVEPLRQGVCLKSPLMKSYSFFIQPFLLQIAPPPAEGADKLGGKPLPDSIGPGHPIFFKERSLIETQDLFHEFVMVGIGLVCFFRLVQQAFQSPGVYPADPGIQCEIASCSRMASRPTRLRRRDRLHNNAFSKHDSLFFLFIRRFNTPSQ